MNKYSLSVLILLFGLSVSAQDKSKRPSPPAQVSQTINGKTITIDYSQPALKGRDFGSKKFHPYGSIWRNGANEATWIEVSDDVTINGETLPKGKYSFFVIPGETEWTLIFNSVWDQWGAYNYDETRDVMRVTAPAGSSDTFTERYTIQLDSTGVGSLNWGDTRVTFTIE